MELKWYAVYTKPRWEKKVAELLNKKRIAHYCPLNKVMRKWHDRKKLVMEPLFTSYVFVRLYEKELPELRKVDGILSVVHWLNKPAVIKDCEIEAIRSFLDDYGHVKLEKVDVRVNDAVEIIHGPLSSQVGSVIEVMNNTVKVHLPSLGYMMVAQVQRTDIQKLILPKDSLLINGASALN